jgi:hypothetical protein
VEIDAAVQALATTQPGGCGEDCECEEPGRSVWAWLAPVLAGLGGLLVGAAAVIGTVIAAVAGFFAARGILNCVFC